MAGGSPPPRVEAPASHSAEAAAETERELVRRQRVRGIVAVAALEAAPLLLVRRVPTRDPRGVRKTSLTRPAPAVTRARDA